MPPTPYRCTVVGIGVLPLQQLDMLVTKLVARHQDGGRLLRSLGYILHDKRAYLR